jgi:hypothetical protein
VCVARGLEGSTEDTVQQYLLFRCFMVGIVGIGGAGGGGVL